MNINLKKKVIQARTLSLPDLKTTALACIIFIAASVIGTVQAGECTKPGSLTATSEGVPDKFESVAFKTIGSLDLGPEAIAAKGYALRTRSITFEPGATIDWHPHTDRPGTVYVLSGEITEYRSDCGAPVVHRVGEISHEFKGMSHGWANLSQVETVIIVADVVPPVKK